jgi:hypothetical protein
MSHLSHVIPRTPTVAQMLTEFYLKHDPKKANQEEVKKLLKVVSEGCSPFVFIVLHEHCIPTLNCVATLH